MDPFPLFPPSLTFSPPLSSTFHLRAVLQSSLADQINWALNERCCVVVVLCVLPRSPTFHFPPQLTSKDVQKGTNHWCGDQQLTHTTQQTHHPKNEPHSYHAHLRSQSAHCAWSSSFFLSCTLSIAIDGVWMDLPRCFCFLSSPKVNNTCRLKWY